MLNFKPIISDDKDFYELYNKAYSWDKNHYCFQSKELPEFLPLFSSFFALYKDTDFIGYGIFNYSISTNHSRVKIFDNSIEEKEQSKQPDKINLAYIINPDYRNQGYGTKLLEYLIEEAKKRKSFDLIEVEVLKHNLESISLIEKQDFEFKYFDDKKIVFEKTIKK